MSQRFKSGDRGGEDRWRVRRRFHLYITRNRITVPVHTAALPQNARKLASERRQKGSNKMAAMTAHEIQTFKSHNGTSWSAWRLSALDYLKPCIKRKSKPRLVSSQSGDHYILIPETSRSVDCLAMWREHATHKCNFVQAVTSGASYQLS
jgi:hypothetical protein